MQKLRRPGSLRRPVIALRARRRSQVVPRMTCEHRYRATASRLRRGRVSPSHRNNQNWVGALILCCTLDGLLLDAILCPHTAKLVAFDGDEAFAMEAVEALFYVVVSASREELLGVERARYRLLRQAEDFAMVEG
jgi:hypothetical protein